MMKSKDVPLLVSVHYSKAPTCMHTGTHIDNCHSNTCSCTYTVHVPYFLKVLPQLEMSLHDSANLINTSLKISPYGKGLTAICVTLGIYDRLITEAVYAHACRPCRWNLATLKLWLHQAGLKYTCKFSLWRDFEEIRYMHIQYMIGAVLCNVGNFRSSSLLLAYNLSCNTCNSSLQCYSDW